MWDRSNRRERMKRLWRSILTSLTLMSVLACAATLVQWARSYRSVEWITIWTTPEHIGSGCTSFDQDYHQCLFSRPGQIGYYRSNVLGERYCRADPRFAVALWHW